MNRAVVVVQDLRSPHPTPGSSAPTGVACEGAVLAGPSRRGPARASTRDDAAATQDLIDRLIVHRDELRAFPMLLEPATSEERLAAMHVAHAVDACDYAIQQLAAYQARWCQ